MRALLLALVLGCFVGASGVSAKVVGLDSRKAIVVGSYPYGVVLKVLHGQTDCTAFLVGPDLALTASHCLPAKGADRHVSVSSHYVDASLRLRNSLPELPFQSKFINAYPVDEDVTQDWALLQLDEEITMQGWLVPAVYNAGRLTVAGHSLDLESTFGVAAIDENCQGGAAVTGRLQHTCDTGEGASGAPLLRYIGNPLAVTATVVGIHLGALTDVDANVGFAFDEAFLARIHPTVSKSWIGHFNLFHVTHPTLGYKYDPNTGNAVLGDFGFGDLYENNNSVTPVSKASCRLGILLSGRNVASLDFLATDYEHMTSQNYHEFALKLVPVSESEVTCTKEESVLQVDIPFDPKQGYVGTIHVNFHYDYGFIMLSNEKSVRINGPIFERCAIKLTEEELKAIKIIYGDCGQAF